MATDVLASDPASEKVEQALNILRGIGVPLRNYTKRRQERIAKSLLAVGHLQPHTPWSEAQSFFDDGPKPVTTREIIRFWNEHYGERLADSSYDDVRRKDLAVLVAAKMVLPSAADPTADTNDGTRGYALSQEGLELIRSYGSDSWEEQLRLFRQNAGVLADRLSKARTFKMIPVKLPSGHTYNLSPVPHNQIQKAVIEEFLPRSRRSIKIETGRPMVPTNRAEAQSSPSIRRRGDTFRASGPSAPQPSPSRLK